jgi:hypothetical protein
MEAIRPVPPTTEPARVDFWHTTMGEVAPGGGSSSFHDSQDARAREGPRRDTCNMDGGGVDIVAFPLVRDVWGDDCNFVSFKDRFSASPGDVLGELRCNKWATATCKKVGSPMTLCSSWVFAAPWSEHTMECLWRGVDGQFAPPPAPPKPVDPADIVITGPFFGKFCSNMSRSGLTLVGPGT